MARNDEEGQMKDTWNPEQYERFKDERSAPVFDLMAMVQGDRRDRAVDLGCGTGEWTQVLHQKISAGETLGLDSSGAMLEKAQAFAGRGVHFAQRRIEDFHEPGQWDLIFSNAALQWCGDHPQLLRRFHDSLKPSGQMAIQMPANHDYPTHVIAEEVAAQEPFRSALKGARGTPVSAPEFYAEELFRIGFREQQVLVRVYPHVLDSREQVVEWVKGTLLTYYQSRLAPELYAQFLQTFRTCLFAKLPDEKPFFYPFKRLFLWGRRAS